MNFGLLLMILITKILGIELNNMMGIKLFIKEYISKQALTIQKFICEQNLKDPFPIIPLYFNTTASLSLSIQEEIRSKFRREKALKGWKVFQLNTISLYPDTGDPYIQVHFKYDNIPYVKNTYFKLIKDSIKNIFGRDLIEFQITKIQRPYLYDDRNEFWIVIKDIDHKDSWHRIK